MDVPAKKQRKRKGLAYSPLLFVDENGRTIGNTRLISGGSSSIDGPSLFPPVHAAAASAAKNDQEYSVHPSWPLSAAENWAKHAHRLCIIESLGLQSDIPAPSRDAMAHVAFRTPGGEARRHPATAPGSNRYENRAPVNTVQCRNGPQCRKFQEGTCSYSHDFSGSLGPSGINLSKKMLNVDSPAFTPKAGNVQPARSMGISPKAAAAAAFTPRGLGSTTPAISHAKVPSADFVPQQALQPTQAFQEFIPGQAFVSSEQIDSQSHLPAHLNPYSDQYNTHTSMAGLETPQPQVNPYAQQSQGLPPGMGFSDTSGYKHPLNYHLYASVGPHREDLLPYQRSAADYFIPDDLREELLKKSEATRQTFAHSTLPAVEHLHSLVALDTASHRTQTTFGYSTSVYKATSSADGHTYALRRIEGYRLSDSAAINTINAWKLIRNASVVKVHEAFTGRWFGDSSMVVVFDYHPCSQTLAEKFFPTTRYGNRAATAPNNLVPEPELWGYIVQLINALNTIHEAGLAAQTMVLSKILVTAKNRLRVSSCGVLDIINYEQNRSVQQLQHEDLRGLGRIIIDIACRSSTAHQNVHKSLETVGGKYTERFRATLAWLLRPLPEPTAQQTQPEPTMQDFTASHLLRDLADKVMSQLDSSHHSNDDLTTILHGELENGRLARLLMKLNTILERPDPTLNPSLNAAAHVSRNQPGAIWSETGERYYLLLFRDYVFHRVDAEGRPVLDLGHVVGCLNKVDAGSEETVELLSRDEVSCFVVSYREVKRGVEAAWGELMKASAGGGRR